MEYLTIRSNRSFSLLCMLIAFLTPLFGCGESRYEKALRTARTLMGNGDLSDTAAVSNMETSRQLLKNLAGIKIRASRHQVYVLEKLLQRYEDMEMWPRAAEVVNELIRLQPTEVKWHVDKGRIYSQWSQVKPNLIEESERAFQTALELNPQSLEARYGLGILYAFRANQVDEARPHLKRVSNHSPITVKNRDIIRQARFALGRMEFEQGNLSQAVNVFQKLSTMDNTAPSTRFLALRNLGRTYQRMGASEMARDTYRKALEIRPNDGGVRRRLRNLGVEPESL